MLRTILTIVAGLVLLGSGYIGLMNNNKLTEEVRFTEGLKGDLDRLNANIAQEKAKTAEAKKVTADANQVTEKLKADTEALTTADVDLNATLEEQKKVIAEYAEKTSLKSTNEEEAKKALAKKLEDLGIEGLEGAETVEQLQEEQAKLEAENTTMDTTLADSKAKIEATKSKIRSAEAALEVAEIRSEDIVKKISPADLKTRIINVQPEIGFAIIGAGAKDGVVGGSRLTVLRGNDKIAELQVSAVEASRSSADIVPDSIAEGQSISNGDQVISIRPVVAITKKPSVLDTPVAAPKKETKEKDDDSFGSDDEESTDSGEASSDEDSDTDTSSDTESSDDTTSDDDSDE